MKYEYTGSGYVSVIGSDGQNRSYRQDQGEITIKEGDKMFPAGQPRKARDTDGEIKTFGCSKPLIMPGVYRYEIQRGRPGERSKVIVTPIRDM